MAVSSKFTQKSLFGGGSTKSNTPKIDTSYGANLGGAGGFSYGIREATKRGYEYIWSRQNAAPFLQNVWTKSEKIGRKEVGANDGSNCRRYRRLCL